MVKTDIQIFDAKTNQHINTWLNGPYDEETKHSIEKMLKQNPKELVDAFYTNLSFGTSGIRGVMGIGTNRMNIYTIKTCTQGLANYINKQPQNTSSPCVLIGYDSRHCSKEFAIECAKVLAGNQIHVYIFKDIRPTPLISFGCRFKNCISALMITASHNPPQYNGYKVYWKDGAQVLAPHNKGIEEEVNKISSIQMVQSVNHFDNPLIDWLDGEIDQAYLESMEKLQLYANDNHEKGHSLNVVYTSLHGTGMTMVPSAMNRWGFTNLEFIQEQMIPDGDFSTCKSPNPEDPEALELGIARLENIKGDVLIATDPDTDRVGTVVIHKGQAVMITGNQLAYLLLNHVLEALSNQKRLPKKAAFVKTIVTSDLCEKICQNYQTTCFNVLPGFKYIAEKIRVWESSPNDYQYIFGGEEALGYLYGTLVRDKDAILSSVLICEMVLQAKLKGKTLVDCLHDLWKKYGVHIDKTLSIHYDDTKSCKEQMIKKLESLRLNPPSQICHLDVLVIEDYSQSIRYELKSGLKERISLPPSRIIALHLTDGSKLVVRPSGTETKIKVYCSVVKKASEDINKALTEGEVHANNLLDALKTQMTLNP